MSHHNKYFTHPYKWLREDTQLACRIRNIFFSQIMTCFQDLVNKKVPKCFQEDEKKTMLSPQVTRHYNNNRIYLHSRTGQV